MKPSGRTPSTYTTPVTTPLVHTVTEYTALEISLCTEVSQKRSTWDAYLTFSDLSYNLLQCQLHFLHPGLSLETQERQKSNGGSQRLSVRSSVRYQTRSQIHNIMFKKD